MNRFVLYVRVYVTCHWKWQQRIFRAHSRCCQKKLRLISECKLLNIGCASYSPIVVREISLAMSFSPPVPVTSSAGTIRNWINENSKRESSCISRSITKCLKQGATQTHRNWAHLPTTQRSFRVSGITLREQLINTYYPRVWRPIVTVHFTIDKNLIHTL